MVTVGYSHETVDHIHTYAQDDDEQGRFLICSCGHRINVIVNGNIYSPVKMPAMRFIS